MKGELFRKFSLVVMLAYAVVTVLAFWNEFEKRSLNQRFESSIKQREELNDKHQKLLDQFGQLIEANHEIK
ncbi:hypothetical protein [Paenibacillus sp. RC84]|uniref:hypothetical protein n=1 Tax=Paenibacillus sp. RC84 TaxID=3156252 RepID=UPI0035130857